MAKDRATTPRGKADPKAGRAGKAAKVKAPRGERIRQLVQAYKMTYARDRQLPLWMGLAFVAAAAVIFLISLLAGIVLFIAIPLAVVFGVLAATFVFGRRAQRAAFSQVEGQPGAAGWVLGNMRGDWRVTQGVQVTAQLDAVHRVLGRPGVVLVGEGAPHRVRGLVAQEKKRVARVVGDTPIYDVILGDGEGEVSIRRLNNHLVKLPRNLSQSQVNALEKRLAALGGTKAAPLPKGPMPTKGPDVRHGAHAPPPLTRYVRTTAVWVSRSCRLRPSRSRISAGMSRITPSVRTAARHRPTGAFRSTLATRSLSNRIPGVCPTSTVNPKYSTANTRRLRLRGSSGAVNRAATSPESTTSTRNAPSRGPAGATEPGPASGSPAVVTRRA